MTMDEYFRQAGLRICGNLNVEKAMLEFIQYIRQFIPADYLFLQKINQSNRAMSNLAAVSAEKILVSELPTLLPEKAFQIIKDYIDNNISVLGNP